MKKIGFLSFGHWTPSSQSQTRSAADTLLQSIDLAIAAEELGADGAYFRVHHFARQLRMGDQEKRLYSLVLARWAAELPTAWAPWP